MNKFILFITLFIASKIIFAEQSGQDTTLNNKTLSIEISGDKSEFIQGETLNFLVKMTNNTGDTIITHVIRCYLNDFHKDSVYTGQSRYGWIIIPPLGHYYYFNSPADFIIKGTDWTNRTLFPGNYEYYISSDNKEFVSNKIHFKVYPVPDSLLVAYNDLIYIPGEVKTIRDYEALYEKYRGTYYEQEFLRKSIYEAAIIFDDHPEYREKAISLSKLFILKYTDSEEAYHLFKFLMTNYPDNKAVIAEILKSLITDKPDCKLLIVLRSKPDQVFKQIKSLLDEGG